MASASFSVTWISSCSSQASWALWRFVPKRHEPTRRNLSGLNDVLGRNPDRSLVRSPLVSLPDGQTLCQDDALAAQEELRTIGIQGIIVGDDERFGASSDPVLILRVVDGANQQNISSEILASPTSG